jgi:hypothetical protein
MEHQVLPSSFRDRNGFVFTCEGTLYRQVNEAHKEHYDHLMQSGLYDALTESGLLVRHEDSGIERAVAPDAYKVISPEVVDFISYPYEWSFSQLKDAALATLSIQRLAMRYGMSLRDASAYNIQFHRGAPILIDTLSFEVLREGEPWIAYRQFCQHFLGPLSLMSYRDARLQQLLRANVDGLPVDLVASLLPFRARMAFPLFLHVFLHARSQRRYSGMAVRDRVSGRFSLRAFTGLIDSLEKGVRRLTRRRQLSGWVDYYNEADHYSSEALEHKTQFVEQCLEALVPGLVWDLGANTGMFSRLASARGATTVSFEMDPVCVEMNYARTRSEQEENLLPLVLDLTNPSPGIGWANEERAPLSERGPADLVIALALVHHLAIVNNVPLERIAAFLSTLGTSLVIEFVPKNDEKVQQLLSNRVDIFPDYTQQGFERAFKHHFDIERREEIRASERVLYLMRTH